MKNQTQNNQPFNDRSGGIVSLTPEEEEASAPESTSLFKLSWTFAIGFLGWYLVVWLIYWLMLNGKPDPQGYSAMFLSLLVFPVQIVTLVILFLVKDFRKIGWGMLSAIAVNLLVSLILGSALNALCFIPFFTRTN